MAELPASTSGPSTKFFFLIGLFCAALIPGWLMSGLISDREGRQAEMARSFSASWGPEQIVTTPLLVIPYQTVPEGPRQYLKIAADKVEIAARLATEDRRRGLFHARVYGAAVQMRGTVHMPSQARIAALLPDHARLLWQESFIALSITNRSGMQDGDRLVWNGQGASFQNCREVLTSEAECVASGPLMARLPEAGPLQPDSEIPFQLAVNLRGTGSFTLASSARQLDMSATAPWPTPSFDGTLLPVSSQVSREGFEARWQAVDYGMARSWSTGRIDANPSAAIIKIDLLDAVPIYRMIHRAAKYHALFLALSFATYLLFEILSGIRIHLVQYGLMALSLSLFALLLLSLAELLGYDGGFLVSALMVLIQASFYTGTVTKRLRETALFALMLAALFGFLYVLLSLETLSLLIGSLALFLVLSVLMALTSRIDWSKWNIGERGAVMRPSSILLRTSGVLLLASSCLLRDPYLLPVRSWALPAILSAGAAVTLWLLTKSKADLLALLIWAAILIVPAGLEARFELRKCQILTLGDQAKLLGGHFMVGYARIGDVAPLAAKGLIGGIYVGRRNIASLQQDIARLQALRQANGLPPLLVAADQEGGIVSRLSPPLTRLPPLSDLAGLPARQRREAAQAYGHLQGSELAALGVTVDFSPVVDLKGAAVRWDRNSFIARRAISADPTIVGDVAESYAQGLRSAGIIPTLKHFPGLGRVQGDTHHIRARLSASTSDLEATDWLPFRRLLADGPTFLMVGHVILDSVDPLQPASRSRPVIDGLIRRQWGFQGEIITDDLTMPSVFHHDFCQAVTGALEAGADLLLLSYDNDQYYRALDCALNGLRQGRLPHLRPVAPLVRGV